MVKKMKFLISFIFVSLSFNPFNYSHAQSKSELNMLQKIIDQMNLPIKRSEDISLIKVYLNKKKWIYVNLFSDKLSKAISNKSQKEVLILFKPEIADICNKSKSLRDNFEWLEIEQQYIDKKENLIYSFNTKKDCQQRTDEVSSKKNKREIMSMIKNMKERINFPLIVSEGVSLIDIYLNEKQVIMYRYLLDNSIIKKLGKHLTTFVKTYTKTACSDKNRIMIKKQFSPFVVGEELVSTDGKKITEFKLNNCN